ncbi:hypothetical protein HDF16_005985 [Granulicella aggregans]|uniref:Uncharacterized protein n=2 Tax=Granulicella aggregans TaxID=474949 RepID=A0A7W8E7B8_9BACT|nr:hypothetical protein [Granulicella aggregans]
MYPEYSRLNLPTWIVGPGVGGGSISERPADMLKVWPEREPIIRQQPATLKVMIDEIIERHCG